MHNDNPAFIDFVGDELFISSVHLSEPDLISHIRKVFFGVFSFVQAVSDEGHLALRVCSLIPNRGPDNIYVFFDQKEV